MRFGDEKFYDKLSDMGIEHYTALDSIVYHLKEGEREAEGETCGAVDFDISKYEVKTIQ